ncbi:MAG TPA: acetyl-CoA carboxylase biotin carboxyl carrier protein [Flammeovirgaceae bacterium]|nr:acetyl-CoA carboxylase biotin carboxyl carrier protein [Flammeovirgaceae bacterium]
MKTKEIRDLIDFIAGTGLSEVKIETEELRLTVRREGKVTRVVEAAAPAVPAPVPAAPAPASQPAAPAPESSSDDESRYVAIKSPMIGTFYRAPNPESDPFVNVGDKVKAGQTVCIIEAMKLFNEIESEVNGTIVKVLVENASPVEYDQPLFLVDPS